MVFMLDQSISERNHKEWDFTFFVKKLISALNKLGERQITLLFAQIQLIESILWYQLLKVIMSSAFKTKHLSPQTIKLRTSFDCLIQKAQTPSENTPIRLNRINFSKGKPYKFPEYQQASDTCYSPSSYQIPLKKNVFRIEKIQKLQRILLEKNYKFKKACNASYKSQKTQRFQKTIVAFQDLQQIDSLSIRRFKQESEQVIRFKEAQKIHELLDSKRRSSTVFVRKGEIGTKNSIRLKDNSKRSYLDQSPYNTLPFNTTKYGNKQNLSTINYLNKTTSFFGQKCQSQRIDPWNVQPQMQIGIV